MKLPLISWLNDKFKFLAADAAKKGITRSLSEIGYEYRNKRKFRSIGVIHPDYVGNLSSTNAKSNNKDAHENQPSSFYSLNKAFNQINLPAGKISMIDIGCGAGRVLSFGMLLRFKEVFGIDLDEPALQKALVNCNLMKQHGYETKFQIDYADASVYEIPASVNVVFLFNPFGMKTMEKTVANLNRLCDQTSEPLFVLYSNPTCQNLFNNNKRCTKIFESFFKSGNPDIFIYRMQRN